MYYLSSGEASLTIHAHKAADEDNRRHLFTKLEPKAGLKYNVKAKGSN
jgi:hypothetical protein